MLQEDHYVSFSKVWSILSSFQGDEQLSALVYTEHHLKHIMGGLSDQLAEFPRSLLESWLLHLSWYELMLHIDLFDGYPEIWQQVLADMALREHVHDNFIPPEALQARQNQLRQSSHYHQLAEQGYWLNDMMLALMEPDPVKATQRLHHTGARWNAVPRASNAMYEGLQEGGRGLARMVSRILPSLGGGLGISQFHGGTGGFFDRAAQTITHTQDRMTQARDVELSKLETFFAHYALTWMHQKYIS